MRASLSLDKWPTVTCRWATKARSRRGCWLAVPSKQMKSYLSPVMEFQAHHHLPQPESPSLSPRWARGLTTRRGQTLEQVLSQLRPTLACKMPLATSPPHWIDAPKRPPPCSDHGCFGVPRGRGGKTHPSTCPWRRPGRWFPRPLSCHRAARSQGHRGQSSTSRLPPCKRTGGPA